jgi:HAD superfamily hydrolase (TIGR01509 family)
MDNIQKNEALVDLMEKLRKKYVLGVATSSNKDRASTILKNLGVSDFFNVVITADDVKKHKPDPAIFLEAAKKLNITPDESVVIEDSLNGIEAAKSGNMRAIGLVTKFLSVETLSEADLVIDSLEELSEKLEGIEGVNLSCVTATG